MTRRGLLVASAAAAAAVAGAGYGWWVRSRRPAEALPVTASAADDAASGSGAADPWSLKFERPQGGELDFATLRGKPLVINFWATWCPPCVREMPVLDRFAREYAAKGWQVVGIAIDRTEAVKSYLERVPVGFPIALAGFAGTDLARAFGNSTGALPFTVAFDADGTLVERQLGETHYETLVAWAGKHG